MDRLTQFENMLSDVQQKYRETSGKLDALKAAGKEKTATFRSLLGDKLVYSHMLTMYKLYGLTQEDAHGIE